MYRLPVEDMDALQRSNSTSKSSLDLAKSIQSARSDNSDEDRFALLGPAMEGSIFPFCGRLLDVLLLLSSEDVRLMSQQNLRVIAIAILGSDSNLKNFDLEPCCKPNADICIQEKTNKAAVQPLLFITFQHIPITHVDAFQKNKYGMVESGVLESELSDDDIQNTCIALERNPNLGALLMQKKIGSGLATRYKWTQIRDEMEDKANNMQITSLRTNPQSFGFVITVVGISVICMGPFCQETNLSKMHVNLVKMNT